MSSLIPIKIAELAVDNLNRRIYELEQEIALIKAAGHTLSLKIHKSERYADFYETLRDFERVIGVGHQAVSDGCNAGPALGSPRGLCEGSCGTGKQKDGRSSNV